MSVLGAPSTLACEKCPGVVPHHHNYYMMTTEDNKKKLLDMLNREGLMVRGTVGTLSDDLKERLEAYVLHWLPGYVAVFPRSIRDLINARANVLKNLTFNSEFRVYTHANGAKIEYIKCTQKDTGKTSATRVVIDTWDDDTRKWKEEFSGPLFELDQDINYVFLDENNKACTFYEKQGAALLAKIAQHEAESFMSKHGMRADMERMRLDVEKDYGDLMNGVEKDARAMGLRL